MGRGAVAEAAVCFLRINDSTIEFEFGLLFVKCVSYISAVTFPVCLITTNVGTASVAEHASSDPFPRCTIIAARAASRAIGI